ncbi:MAG: hypothetical protein FDW93_05960 [Bergeyella sp.]|nr:hypothetical protein [Bergeyella sp.]
MFVFAQIGSVGISTTTHTEKTPCNQLRTTTDELNLGGDDKSAGNKGGHTRLIGKKRPCSQNGMI